jgi:hypothetical protein
VSYFPPSGKKVWWLNLQPLQICRRIGGEGSYIKKNLLTYVSQKIETPFVKMTEAAYRPELIY